MVDTEPLAIIKRSDVEGVRASVEAVLDEHHMPSTADWVISLDVSEHTRSELQNQVDRLCKQRASIVGAIGETVYGEFFLHSCGPVYVAFHFSSQEQAEDFAKYFTFKPVLFKPK